MTRGDEAYEKAKAAAAAAQAKEDEAQEALRKKMETRGHAPKKLTRAETARARRMDDGRGGEVKPKKRFGR